MGKTNNEDEEEMYVTLSLDDGTEEECLVLTIFEADNKKEYIALLPTRVIDKDDEESEVYLYAYAEDKEGNPILTNISNDEEYEMVSDAFDELLDDEAFEEMDNND